MDRPIFVTEPSLPDLEDFIPSLRKIWDNKWLTNNGECAFLECGFVSFGKYIVDGIFIQEALAVHLFDEASGRLALAEAGKGDVCFLFVVNRGNSLFKGFGINGKFDYCLGAFGFGYVFQAHWLILHIVLSFFLQSHYFNVYIGFCQVFFQK